MTQGRRYTFRVSIIDEGEAKKNQTVLCKMNGGVDFVLINGRRLDQETVEIVDDSVAVFTVEPRGHGLLTVIFSLVGEEDVSPVEYTYLVAEEPEYRPSIRTAAPFRRGLH